MPLLIHNLFNEAYVKNSASSDQIWLLIFSHFQSFTAELYVGPGFSGRVRA